MTVIIRKNSWRFADGSLLSEEEKDKLRKEMSLELETDLKDTGRHSAAFTSWQQQKIKMMQNSHRRSSCPRTPRK